MGFFSAVKRFFGQKSPQEEKNAPLSAPREAGAESPAELDISKRDSAPAVEPAADAPLQKSPALEVEKSPETIADEAHIESPPGGGEEKPHIGAALTRGHVPEEPNVAEGYNQGAPLAESAEPEIISGTQDKSLTLDNGARDAMIVALRQSEPKLSSWLAIVLEGQEEVNEEFWERLRFLLQSLEAPPAEVDEFIADFAKWLERMEYRYIDEFRSELQYRLALALDLEDEEDERNRLLIKLEERLAATRNQLGRKLNALFAAHGELSDSFWEEMEELFIMADMGYETSLKVVENLKNRAAKEGIREAAAIRHLLQDELEDIFRTEPRIRAVNKPEVVLAMGVNGAGKTTTIAKLAYRERLNGKKVLVAAGDTFRAAAMEQLQVWAERAGVEFYAKPAGSDPASVAWEAVDYALKNDIDIIFVDTAGRLQTRVNLMDELGKIRQVLAKKHPGSPHRSLLVLDATTGQNALSQAKLFREAAGADEIILTKLDGTAKGGVAIAVAMQEKLPITFIGLGEKMEDLRPFNGRDFAEALLQQTDA